MLVVVVVVVVAVVVVGVRVAYATLLCVVCKSVSCSTLQYTNNLLSYTSSVSQSPTNNCQSQKHVYTHTIHRQTYTAFVKLCFQMFHYSAKMMYTPSVYFSMHLCIHLYECFDIEFPNIKKKQNVMISLPPFIILSFIFVSHTNSCSRIPQMLLFFVLSLVNTQSDL